MDKVIDHVAGADVEQMNLAELQLSHQVVGSIALAYEPPAASQAIGSDQRYIAHFPVAYFLNERLARG